MRGATAVVLPSAGAWRARLRGARRNHHERSLGDVLTDLYLMLWLVLVYGGALASELHRHLQASTGGPDLAPETAWIIVAALLAGTGLGWKALQALGPLMATPAEQTWGVSTPLDRRGWLLPRFISLAAVGALGAAVVIAGVAFFTSGLAALGWAALAGATSGVAGVSALAVGQASSAGQVRARWVWPRLTGNVLVGAGAALALGVVAAHSAGQPLAPPVLPPLPAVAGVAVLAAAMVTGVAVRSLARVDLTALNAGAQIATAALTAMVWLDPSLLTGVLEVRRWRAVATVRSRRLRAGAFGRVPVLLEAEVRRQLRRPSALAVWLGLALAVYAVALVAPTAVGVVRLILGYLAAGRLMAGLRALASSPGLRRALGGSQREQRLTHVIVPALGTVLWWALTAGAGGVHLDGLDVILVAGVVAAAYRAATRPPMSYGGAVIETPFGLLPLGLVLQLARGPDLLSALLILQVLWGQ